jgi:hypothetical protein
MSYGYRDAMVAEFQNGGGIRDVRPGDLGPGPEKKFRQGSHTVATDTH